MSEFTLHLGDSREVLKTFAESSVDSIVCDPPYELTASRRTVPAPFVEGSPYSRHRVGVNGDNKPVGGFMGKEWDGTGVAFDAAVWMECLRVLKPGGHLLAFSGTRTYHRMVCAIEDAGFDIRDQIGWLYGSGFPKSHNGEWGGTALKPAWEPIVMARKPLVGTVEANWLAYGTGALNIDQCRIKLAEEDASQLRTMARGVRTEDGWGMNGDEPEEAVQVVNPAGRWPSNIITDGSDEVLAGFPFTSSGTGAVKRATGAEANGNTGAAFGAESRPAGTPMICHGDEGSAARFFYCAKASQEDRNEGAKNVHPTVKPTDLMRYLCRLVTPKGGLVLDPFMGSGSTGKAAMLENFSFVGIDMTPEYVEIARARIDFARRQGYQPDLLESA